MYCRVTEVQGKPDKVDEGIAHYEQKTYPALKQQKGFAGATLVGSRQSGKALSVTYWEDEQALKDSDSNPETVALRKSAVEAIGATGAEVSLCEVASLERFQPAKTGVPIRLVTFKGDPAKLDEGIKFFNSEIV